MKTATKPSGKHSLLAASVLLLAVSTSGQAATEIYERDQGYENGPTFGSVMMDTAVGKPLQGIYAAVGTATWLATLPFTILSGSYGQTGRVMVAEPVGAFLQRCMGCTPEQDRTRRAHEYARMNHPSYHHQVYFYEGDTLEYSDDPFDDVVVHPFQH